MSFAVNNATLPQRARCFAVGLIAASIAVAAIYRAAAQDVPKNFIMHPAPKPVAAISFADDQGQTRSLADFKGKVIVLNIWATWCGPCRKEMPSLDRLQLALTGPDLAVVPVSIDRGGIDAVSKFYAETGVTHLAKYIDTSGSAVRELGVVGVPATLIIGPTGDEIGRVVGPAEWDAPEVIELLKPLIAKKPSD